jgi:hypothetical protein
MGREVCIYKVETSRSVEPSQVPLDHPPVLAKSETAQAPGYKAEEAAMLLDP